MMDMHHFMAKLVTYSTLGLVKDRNRKQREEKRSQSPQSIPSNDGSCLPMKHSGPPVQRERSGSKVTTRVNRSEAKRSGNVNRISSLQALSGAAHGYYRDVNNNTIHENNHPLHGLYVPDVTIRHGSISLSDEYILAQGLLRTVCIA